MSEAKDVLAIDIGSSSVRAAVISKYGQIICKVQRPYNVIISDKYSMEQNPEILAQEVVEAMKEALQSYEAKEREVGAICFSSQMYNIFPVDCEGRPLYNMLLWSDSRSEAQAERLKSEFGRRYLYDETGCPMDSMFPFAKLIWLKENYADVFNRAKKFISIKEYLLKLITGQYIVDYSMASATGMFDIKKLCWSEKALKALGISTDQLSTPVSGLEKYEFQNCRLRTELGLPEEIVVVSGGGDGPLASIGSGASLDGYMNIDLGTSGAARVVTNKPVLDTKERLWSFAVTENMWVYGGILSTVGNGYKWLVENFQGLCAEDPDSVYRNIAEKIGRVQPDLTRVVFIPYLLKERSPNWDTRAKAVIYNLTVEDDFFTIANAYLESIAYSLLSIIEIIEEQVHIPKLIMTGGLVQSKQIARMMADILGREIVIRESFEGSLMGAAIMGLKAIDEIDNYCFQTQCLQKERTISFDTDLNQIYKEKYRRFCKLNKALRDIDL